MRRLRPSLKSSLLAGLLLASAPLAAQDAGVPMVADHGELAIMGTIPLYWGEVENMESLLTPDGTGHWARPVIEAHYRLRPLDYLSAEALAGHRRLLLAQPRGLSAEENVALDAWVRSGGQLLLFADPMMTGHSRFAIGDRRRPQDVALLSPILGHWGLELHYDPAQPDGLRYGDGVPQLLPVAQAGELMLTGDDGACALSQARIVAECRLGAGAVLIVADAAVFDGDAPGEGAAEALEALLARIFGNLLP